MYPNGWSRIISTRQVDMGSATFLHRFRQAWSSVPIAPSCGEECCATKTRRFTQMVYEFDRMSPMQSRPAKEQGKPQPLSWGWHIAVTVL